MSTYVIGSGGVGFWLNVALARAGIPFSVFDDDTLEGGLGYTRLPQAALGTRKVDLLKGFCVAVMGTQKIDVVPYRFDGEEAIEGDLVVDCSDMDLKVRREIYDKVKAAGARYLRVSYDGLNETVVVAEGLPLAGRKGGGYAEKPDLGLSFMAGGIGALAVQRILKGYQEHVEFQITLSEYFGVTQQVVEVDMSALAIHQGIVQTVLAGEPTVIDAIAPPQDVLGGLDIGTVVPKAKRKPRVKTA